MFKAFMGWSGGVGGEAGRFARCFCNVLKTASRLPSDNKNNKNYCSLRSPKIAR